MSGLLTTTTGALTTTTIVHRQKDRCSQPTKTGAVVQSRRRCSSTAVLGWSTNVSRASRMLRNPESRTLHRPARGAAVVTMASAAGQTDLLIVGPGVLGSLVGVKWLEKFPGAQVVGQTNTTSRHADLSNMGIKPRLKVDAGDTKFANVIFCAPPSGSDEYISEVAAAAQLWSGSGNFVFTSSSGVYSEEDGIIYQEDSPTVPRGTPYKDRMLDAEEVVLQAQGCVLRLAGLYHAKRGAHMYYLKVGEVPVRGNGMLNLIHYEDAASLSVEALAAGYRGPNVFGPWPTVSRGAIFIGCDNNPVSKSDMMKATLTSGKYGDQKVNFTATEGSTGRLMNNSHTRKVLKNWKPKYASFEDFTMAYAACDVTGEASWDMLMEHADLHGM